MIAFGHTAIGTAVGLYTTTITSDPITGCVAALGVGILSHYVADFIPHGHLFGINARNYKDTLKACLKGRLSSFAYQSKIIQAIFFYLFFSLALFIGIAYLKFDLTLSFLFILFGIAGSQLPDVLDGLIYLKFLPRKGFFRSENYFHQLVHWHGREDKGLKWDLKRRDFWQVGVVIGVLFFLLK